jgi:biotin operon repressor
MNDEPALQQQIERLNYIIGLLIKENQQLKSILGGKAQANEPNNPISCNPLNGEVLNHLISSNPLNGEASNNLITSNPLNGVVSNNLISSNPLNGEASNHLISSNPLNGEASNQLLQPHASQINPLNPSKQVNIFDVLKTMRVNNVTASHTSVKNSLKLLLHLAENPQNNTKQLSKATGMSQSGLSKRLSALRKQGYVTKLKVRHYVLTPKALALLGK